MTRLKEFVTTYLSYIVRFWTNQLVCSITGISVGLATIALNNLFVSIVGTVFSIGFICFLQYDNMFQLGEKHHYKHVSLSRPQKTLGLKISMLSSWPLFLLIAVGLVLQITSLEGAAAICKLLYYVLQGPYVQLHAFVTSAGILTADSLGSQCFGWVFYLLYTAPVVIVSAVGYLLGSLDRPLRTFFGFKHPGQKKVHH